MLIDNLSMTPMAGGQFPGYDLLLLKLLYDIFYEKKCI